MFQFLWSWTAQPSDNPPAQPADNQQPPSDPQSPALNCLPSQQTKFGSTTFPSTYSNMVPIFSRTQSDNISHSQRSLGSTTSLVPHDAVEPSSIPHMALQPLHQPPLQRQSTSTVSTHLQRSMSNTESPPQVPPSFAHHSSLQHHPQHQPPHHHEKAAEPAQVAAASPQTCETPHSLPSHPANPTTNTTSTAYHLITPATSLDGPLLQLFNDPEPQHQHQHQQQQDPEPERDQIQTGSISGSSFYLVSDHQSSLRPTQRSNPPQNHGERSQSQSPSPSDVISLITSGTSQQYTHLTHTSQHIDDYRTLSTANPIVTDFYTTQTPHLSPVTTMYNYVKPTLLPVPTLPSPTTPTTQTPTTVLSVTILPTPATSVSLSQSSPPLSSSLPSPAPNANKTAPEDNSVFAKVKCIVQTVISPAITLFLAYRFYYVLTSSIESQKAALIQQQQSIHFDLPPIPSATAAAAIAPQPYDDDNSFAIIKQIPQLYVSYRQQLADAMAGAIACYYQSQSHHYIFLFSSFTLYLIELTTVYTLSRSLFAFLSPTVLQILLFSLLSYHSLVSLSF